MATTSHILEQEKNPWQQQAARFNQAAEKLKLDEGLWRVLQQPNREIIVHIPVNMDNGQLEVFTGYRVQHSIARGPAKGGVRYAPDVTLDDLRDHRPHSSKHGQRATGGVHRLSRAALDSSRPRQGRRALRARCDP